MGSAIIPAQNFTNILISTTATASAANSVLLLEIDGVVYPSGYRVDYSGGFRNFYPAVDTNGQVLISCHTIAYGENLPEYTLPSTTRVLVISV